MVRLLLLAATLQCASNYHLPAAAPPRRAVAAVAPSFARLSPLRMEAFSFDPFDRDVFRILMDAQSEARVLGASAVGTQHLLLAATLQKDDVQASLENCGVTKDTVRGVLKAGKGGVPGLDRLFAATAKDELLPFGKDTERALKQTVNRLKGQSDELINWRELMLTVLDDDGSEDTGATGALAVLKELQVTRERAYKAIEAGERELVGAGNLKRKKGNSTLDQCSVDLTSKARAGLLDPLVGRETEVKRCMQILVRRRKNNPVLIGDPGVGKTAIAEGLAQLIVDEKVPPKLKDSRILSLELGLLVADTKYRGEFEQRLRDVIEEVTKSPDIILFIDEIHTLVGAGAAEGAIDAANLLKPSLARGELQCIGATTIEEYRQYIEKDAALERRFQPVKVDEPTREETVAILTTLSKRYSEHHVVTYEPEALEAAAKLSERYISDRFLPDKAIDLMDEAGALVQIGKWDGTGGAKSDRPMVGAEDVASIVSDWTGIPLSKLTADEAASMLDFEELLHERVIGQNFAVSAIARALRRARVGLRSPRRPVASMIFCGPTGVGKTELAKAVAEGYYGDEKAMVRLDMSEYMESFSVSRLTGPPPGYVGYEAGGQLTEAVRRTPHTVVLLDEVEKAHPDVFNVLLQVLEDGRLTDNKGRTIDFANTMLILTSNVGSRKILQTSGLFKDADKAYSQMRAGVKEELGKAFRPEFLNRLDEVIVFESLNQDQTQQICGLMLKELVDRCEENEVELKYTKKLTKAIVGEGYSPTYGARPLRRAVQRLCEDAVAEAMLGGFVNAGEKLELDAGKKPGEVILKNSKGKTKVHEASAAQGIEDDSGFGGEEATTTVKTPADKKREPVTK